jgi:molybdopterin adenylyltransferase
MPIRIGIVTVSDRCWRGERQDESGPALAEAITGKGWEVTRTAIIPDELGQIQGLLTDWADSDQMDVILTTGGTGFSPRDVTPEATEAAIQRPTPGLSEAMRGASLRTTPHAMLSRATAGIRAHTLIINLPGSPAAAVENLDVLSPALPHAVQLLHNEPTAETGHHKV